MKRISIEQLAQVCHEANRAYCQTLGDMSQPAWAEAPDWQRNSAIAGVRFHLTHPDAGPAASHEEWYKVKLLSGWKWGPVKDPEKKEHPCMVTYQQLPAEQQAKDRLFVNIIVSLEQLVIDIERSAGHGAIEQ